MNVTDCECVGWAGDLGDMTSEHHPECPKSEAKTYDLIQALTDGIERWAAEEDGVPEHLWHTYQRAKAYLA